MMLFRVSVVVGGSNKHLYIGCNRTSPSSGWTFRFHIYYIPARCRSCWPLRASLIAIWPVSSFRASAMRNHLMISMITESEITSSAVLFCDIGALNIYVVSKLTSIISFQSWAKFITRPNKMVNMSY
jgi:hypothetical protein